MQERLRGNAALLSQPAERFLNPVLVEGDILVEVLGLSRGQQVDLVRPFAGLSEAVVVVVQESS